MSTWLADTGPLVAYISGRDPMHRRVASRIDGFSGRLVTTSAVVTEVMYFLSDVRDGPTAFAELLLVSGTQVAELTQPADILAAAKLMEKYADTPMDFADATLVMLADAIGVFDVLTLDRRGFTTYRTGKGKSFRLVLTGAP